jgi:hypothetical protein
MAVYEALLLNTVVPQIQAAQTGDSYVMVVNATTPALRITQTGTGDSILVEDAANPDSSPFVVTAAGDVGIGTASPTFKLQVIGTSQLSLSAAGTQQALQLNNSDTTAGTQAVKLGFSSAGVTKASINAAVYGNDYMTFNVGSDTECARISSDGTFRVKGAGTAGSTDAFQVAGTAPASSLLLNSSGNLGLGVTPSAWDFGGNLVLPGAGTYVASKNINFTFAANLFYGGGAEKYVASNPATKYLQGSGTHAWFNAPSGTANDPITFIQAMTLDASGNLGVGTTSPAYKLQVGKTDGTANVETAIFSGASYGVQTIYGLVGTSTFVVGNNNSGSAHNGLPTGTAGMWMGQAYPLVFGTNGTERARITSGGYFKASNTGTYLGSTGGYHELRSNTDNNNAAIVSHNGTNGTQYGLSIRTTDDQNDATRNFLECLGGATLRAAFYTNGGLSNYSANNVNLASDERLKKDISPLLSTWDKLKTIEVVNFRYKDCNEGDPLLYGVIAQQVQPIVPELVVVTKEAQEAVEAKDAVLDADGNVVEPAVAAKEATPEYYGIREQPMYWLAIKALQEAMARIETLEAKIAALEAK